MKVLKIFNSIQGEGLNTGLPTVFVRLAGCDLMCSYCDTKESWFTSNSKIMTLEEVYNEVQSRTTSGGCVCITGGEPLLQKEEVSMLCALLARDDLNVEIETNGKVPLDDFVRHGATIVMDIKCPSSGVKLDYEFSVKQMSHLSDKDMVKFVVEDKEDLDYMISVLKIASLHIKLPNIIVSPVYHNNKPSPVLKDIIDLIRSNLKDDICSKIRLGLPLHKIIEVE